MTRSVLDGRPAQPSTAPTSSSPDPGSRQAAPEPEARRERPFGLLGAGAAAVTLAVFLTSIRNGWVNWDDAASRTSSTLGAGGAGGRQ